MDALTCNRLVALRARTFVLPEVRIKNVIVGSVRFLCGARRRSTRATGSFDEHIKRNTPFPNV